MVNRTKELIKGLPPVVQKFAKIIAKDLTKWRKDYDKRVYEFFADSPKKPKSKMAKQMRVEASVQTKGRFRDGSGKYIFCIYEEFSNETLKESAIYTTRSNAKRGALRYAKREKMKIVLWVK